MCCFAVSFVALALVAADQKLIPSAHLVCTGEVDTAAVSRDGRSLIGGVKDEERYDLVVWDIANQSKFPIVKGADFLSSSLLPDGQKVFGSIYTKRGKGLCDVDYFVCDIPSKLRTNLLTLKKTFAPALSSACSADGTILAIADGNARRVHIWKRDAAARWNALRVLEVAQREAVPTPALLDIALTPNGKQVFVFVPILDKDSRPWSLAVEKWDIRSGCRLPFPVVPMKAMVTMAGQFLFMAGDRTLCIQGEEGTGDGVVGIDTTSGKRKYNLPCVLTGASISPDGQTGAVVRSTSNSRANSPIAVSFWNFDDGSRLRCMTVPRGGGRPSGVFSADSRSFVLTADDVNHQIHVFDVSKAGTRTTLTLGDHSIEIEKAEIRSSYSASGPIKGLSLLNSGEIATVGIESQAIVICRINTQ
jgi:WD40 repeat protein